MEKTYWLVLVPLMGTGEWFELAKCLTPGAAINVVASLLTNDAVLITSVRIDVRKELGQ